MKWDILSLTERFLPRLAISRSVKTNTPVRKGHPVGHGFIRIDNSILSETVDRPIFTLAGLLRWSWETFCKWFRDLERGYGCVLWEEGATMVVWSTGDGAPRKICVHILSIKCSGCCVMIYAGIHGISFSLSCLWYFMRFMPGWGGKPNLWSWILGNDHKNANMDTGESNSCGKRSEKWGV